MKCGYCGKELSAALQERDRLIEALRQVDVECRYCAHADFDPPNCVDNCEDCRAPCPCRTCEERSNWKWKGFGEGGGDG